MFYGQRLGPQIRDLARAEVDAEGMDLGVVAGMGVVVRLLFPPVLAPDFSSSNKR
jgi:hypothetical protein